MNPIRKSTITALALSAAVLFATSLLAKPRAQNYPEYPQNEGIPTLKDPNAGTEKKGAEQKARTPAGKEAELKDRSKESPQVAKAGPGAKAGPAGSTEATMGSRFDCQPDTTIASGIIPWSSADTSNTVCCAGCSVGTRFDSNLVMVEKFLLRSPGTIGGEVQYKVRVTANAPVSNVGITENLPEGVTFISAEGADVARGAGNTLTWKYPQMQRRDVQEVLITVRTDREGTFTANTGICVDPVICVAFNVGTPRLEIEKTGPTTAELDVPVTYTITVRNVGTATAQNVVVVDNLPEGLTAEGSQRSFPVGNLGPGDSKTVNVTVTPIKEGAWVNNATVTSSNTDAAKTDPATQPKTEVFGKGRIQVNKTGPDQLFIHREALYNITVTNVGAVELKDIVVTDSLPKGAQLMSVSGQPVTQNRDKVVWNIASLPIGESKTDTVSFTMTDPGTTVNNVTAEGSPIAGGNKVTDSSTATTKWEGPPGVLTEIVDDIDPIRVGSIVTFTITITNQGSYRDINTQVKVLFGDEITPQTCDASGATIDGKVVTLPDGFLKPNSKMSFKIRGKAEVQGLHTTRLQFNSSFLPRPVDKDETTYVY